MSCITKGPSFGETFFFGRQINSCCPPNQAKSFLDGPSCDRVEIGFEWWHRQVSKNARIELATQSRRSAMMDRWCRADDCEEAFFFLPPVVSAKRELAQFSAVKKWLAAVSLSSAHFQQNVRSLPLQMLRALFFQPHAPNMEGILPVLPCVILGRADNVIGACSRPMSSLS